MNEDEKVCPYCGGVIKKVAIKCKHCKALLNKEQSNNTNTNKKKDCNSNQYNTYLYRYWCSWM